MNQGDIDPYRHLTWEYSILCSYNVPTATTRNVKVNTDKAIITVALWSSLRRRKVHAQVRGIGNSWWDQSTSIRDRAMEQTLRRAAIVSRSTPAEEGKERKEREGKRERVCVCACVRWLCVSRLNDSKMWTEGGKAQCKPVARLRHYSPPAHGAACGFI